MAGTSDTPDGRPVDPDDINSRLAEIAAELASEARFKEPSAAERARLRVTAIRPATRPVRRGPFRHRRARRKATELRQPVQAAGAPPPPAPARPSRRARRDARRQVPDRGYADAAAPSVLRSGTTVAVIVMLLIGVSIGLRYAFRYSRTPAPEPAASNTPAVRPTPTPAATVSSLPAFNPFSPFAGTPADSYADGAAGIVPPAAARKGPFSAGQVRTAYATTRSLLIDGYLDQHVLYGGPPTAFAGLLDHSERAQFLRDLNRTGVSASGQQLSSRDWVNSFAVGTELVGSVIKVHGEMTAATARNAGRTVLRVRTDYLFVYPVDDHGDLASGLRVVNRVVLTVDFAPFNEPASSALAAHVYSIAGGPTGVQCGIYDGYVHPAFPGSPGSPGATARPAATPIDPYDQSSQPTNLSCVPSTGT